jgi:hypothetical protein
MSADTTLQEREDRYAYLALKNANHALSHDQVLELMKLREMRRRVGKSLYP